MKRAGRDHRRRIEAGGDAATSASFHARRCTCQMPRPTRIARPIAVAMAGATRRRMITPSGAALCRPVAVLLGDEEALQRAEQAEGEDEDQRDPEERVDPVGRREGELDEEGEADDDEADDHDDEDRRAIAGIGEGKVEAAGLAALRRRQEAGEQAALAAARAEPAHASLGRGKRGIEGAVLVQPAAPSIGAPQPPQT